MVPAVLPLAPSGSPDWGPFPVVTAGNINGGIPGGIEIEGWNQAQSR